MGIVGWMWWAWLGPPTWAQDDAVQRELTELRARADQLEKDIAALKSAGNPSNQAATEAQLNETRQRIDTLNVQLEQLGGNRGGGLPPEALPAPYDTRFSAGGRLGVVTDTDTVSFNAGPLTMAWAGRAGKELDVDAGMAFFLNDENVPIAMVDRLALNLKFTRGFNVRAGKIYSPYGYYNAAIPGGTFVQPLFSRPGVLRFEHAGASFATRQGGVDLHGRHIAGFWQVGYHAGVGNGRNPDLDQTQDLADTSLAKATWGQLWVQSPSGVQIGVTGAYDPIRVSEGVADISGPVLGESVDEILGVGHLAWVTRRMELMAEVYYISHATDGSDPEFSRSGFVQWSHRYRPITPFVRADYLERWADDPLYQAMEDTRSELVGTVGARRDLNVRAAVSAELFGGPRVIYLPDTTTTTETTMGAAGYLSAAF